MTLPICSFIDLEGVLVPEMWPHLAAEFGIGELKATTREVPNYRQLMDQRLSALARHRITLAEVCRAVDRLAPFNGAVEFIAQLKKLGRVIIVSDSFRPMNSHFLDMLSVDDVLCHDFTTGPDGLINGLNFWNDLSGKHQCYQHIDVVGFTTFAMGDALNDITLIRAATIGAFFCPSPTTVAAAPDIEVVSTYRKAMLMLSDRKKNTLEA